jgi:hypothetical protein
VRDSPVRGNEDGCSFGNSIFSMDVIADALSENLRNAELFGSV